MGDERGKEGNEVKCRMQERIWSVNKFDNMTHALFLIWLQVENISDLSIWRYRVKINLKTHYLSLVKSDKE